DNPSRTMHMVNQPLTGDPEDFCTSDDAVTMGVQAATHWDALSHVSYGGKLYNGFDADEIDQCGAHKLGIEHVGPLATRGVLVDLLRTQGVDQLDDGYQLTGDDLDAA